MPRELVRIALVLLVVVFTAYGCILGGRKRTTGGGTNLGSDWGSDDDTGGTRPQATDPR